MPGYMCVVPGCKSGSKVPAHAFPKDLVRALEWKRIVNSPRLDGILEQQLNKFYVCALHFKQEDTILTSARRKLKHDAVPCLLLPKLEGDMLYNLQEEMKEAREVVEPSIKLEEGMQ